MKKEKKIKELKERLKINVRDSKKVLRLQVPFVWEIIDKTFSEVLGDDEK